MSFQMNNIQNQKSGLAKLMATENLTVQHAKTFTASFDPKNRILTCPIWTEMSGDLYDLLMGHEVGHALDTPADGWHGAVHDRGRSYKGFLNVIEDARFEKRQKRRYPGLRKSFVNGFNELMQRDFFGLKNRDINTMSFIDRLNVYTKSSYSVDIQFNDIEKDFVDRVQKCETFEEVLTLTNEIWDYSKDEQQQTEMPQDDFSYEFDENGEEFEVGSGDGDAETDGEGNQKAKSKAQGGEGDQESDDPSGGNNQSDESDEDGEETKSAKSDSEDGDQSSDDQEDGNTINRHKETKSIAKGYTDFEPRCETDENYRQNETSLIAKNAREYLYVNIPTPNLKNIVTPAKRVQEILTEEFSTQRQDYQQVTNTLYADFRKKNERYISLLAKEFEMRKAAQRFAKAKTASTGDIDISRVFKYQIDDNIFKKIMRVPKGKSHGLVLLLDKSGSMSENLTASLEQILILAMFCRKVNIPFTAYGFGNAENVRLIDFPNDPVFDAYGQVKDESFSGGCFSEKHNDMQLSSVYLREMINSKMSISEFSSAVKNILCLMDAFQHRYSYGKYFHRPASEALSNTPLTEALIASQTIINEFRKMNNLDIVNLCVVHDGDADSTNGYHISDTRNYFRVGYQNVFLCDKKEKVQYELTDNDDGCRIAVSKWLTKTTGAKVIGFYLAPNHQIRGVIRRQFVNDEIIAAETSSKKYTWEWKSAMTEMYNKYAKNFRKDKYLESKKDGYASFFIISGGNDLEVGDDTFDAPDKVTATTLSKAFGKFTKNRQVNRVLVSRFIGMIAA
jgi:hypothetical protein